MKNDEQAEDPKIVPTQHQAPLRVRQRPDPCQWSESELMTLGEAAALFWPAGPLTTTSLRTAVRDKKLEVAEIAGKLLTNKLSIMRMSVCRPRTDAEAAPAPVNRTPQSVAEVRTMYAADLAQARRASRTKSRVQ